MAETGGGQVHRGRCEGHIGLPEGPTRPQQLLRGSLMASVFLRLAIFVERACEDQV